MSLLLSVLSLVCFYLHLLYLCRLFLSHIIFVSLAVSFFLKSFLYVLFSVSIPLYGRRLFMFPAVSLPRSTFSLFLLSLCIYPNVCLPVWSCGSRFCSLSVLELIHLDSALKRRPAAPSSPLFSPPLFHPLILSSSFQSVAFSLSLSLCFMPLPVGFLPHLGLMFEHL